MGMNNCDVSLLCPALLRPLLAITPKMFDDDPVLVWVTTHIHSLDLSCYFNLFHFSPESQNKERKLGEGGGLSKEVQRPLLMDYKSQCDIDIGFDSGLGKQLLTPLII